MSRYTPCGAASRVYIYWLVLPVPILQFGANALFFLLHTWLFFLALLPVFVLVDVIYYVLLGGELWLTVLVTGLSVLCLFCLCLPLSRGGKRRGALYCNKA